MVLHVFSHNYAKIEINSDDNLPLQTMTLHNEIILIKSVFNKDQNHYYYIFRKIFLSISEKIIATNFFDSSTMLWDLVRQK